MIDQPEQAVRAVVELAERELMARFRHVAARHKLDGSLVTEADLAMQEAMLGRLREHWPEVPILGEEMDAAEQARRVAEPGLLWCLDPLDGTSNFAQGVPWFAVSLALLDGGRPVLGIVYDPVRQELFEARAGAGARLNGAPLRTAESYSGGRIAMIDFKRLPLELAQRVLVEPIYSSQRNFGSAALDWCQLAAGRAAFYLHGRQNLWDYAAGALVLAEAGGLAVDLEGGPLGNGDRGPRSAVAAPNQALFEEWTAWLGVTL